MAKPKLALIPAAQGDKFYSVLPSDGVGDFDFTRNSSATRIAPTGFIETSELFGSELVTNGDFATDSDWTKGTGWSIANGVAALDGTQTTGSGLGSTTISVVSGKRYKIVVNVLSSSSGFRLYDSYGVIAYGLSLGVNVFYITASSSTYQITPLGLSGTTGSIDNVSVKEQIGKSRLNYDLLNGKVVNCPHYLLEPARTNLITYSEDFSQWTVDRVTVSENQIISPNGTLNADSIAENSENNIHRIYIGSITLTDNVDYTITVFAKKGNSKVIQLTPTSTSAIGSGRANFDLDNGVLGAVSGGTAEIKDYGNGWYRCSYSFEALATATSAISVNLVNDDLNAARNVTYLGNTNNNVYLWGAQFEQGSYPTSYIPTTGTAITRAAESANGSGDAATFNDSEGVLMLEASALANGGTNRRITISDGTTNNRILIGYTSSDNEIIAFLSSGGSSQFVSISSIPKSTDFNKIVIKYKVNDFALWVNGFELATDTSGNAPIGLNTLQFKDGNSTLDFYGNTREVQYFDSALTDAQLETLTSWTSLQEMITSQLYTNY